MIKNMKTLRDDKTKSQETHFYSSLRLTITYLDILLGHTALFGQDTHQ